MKYRVKAHKNSDLYFKCFVETAVKFELNELGYEENIKTFDTWQDANLVAEHFNGYIEVVEPDKFCVYWNSNTKKFIPELKNIYFQYNGVIEDNLMENCAKELARALNISYEFAMRNDKNG